MTAAETRPLFIRAAVGAGKARGNRPRSLVAPWLLLALFTSACAPAVSRPPAPLDASADPSSLEHRAQERCCRQRPACDLPPHPFTTDVCTLWPDGDWGACCIEHDMAYWCGGPDDERARADETLRACIEAEHRSCFAGLTYLGTRIGGASWMPFPWRWGYGWDWLEDP